MNESTVLLWLECPASDTYAALTNNGKTYKLVIWDTYNGSYKDVPFKSPADLSRA